MLSACIERSIYARIQMVAEAMGISLSEYIRRLIINDLEKRSVFDSLYKQPLPDREEEASGGGNER